MSDLVAAVAALPERTLLLLDDDSILCRHLGRALDAHGFVTRMVGAVGDAIEAVRSDPPAFAVLDLRLQDGSGLKVVQILREQRPDARIVMLTGYGNIATAVAAVRAGAVDYLAKPADAEDVVRALLGTVAGGAPAPPENPMSADRVRWEHIQRVYEMCGRNVSETARRLGMHRRTLQRILAKRAPR
jgi:two-component system response regulator RegA